VKADGGSCRTVNMTSSYAAGGAGGSIHVEAAVINGTGRMTAIGGNGYNRHGGGGGRIAVYYGATSNFGFDTNIKAYGGRFMKNQTTNNANGGAGTIYLRDHTQQYGDLIIDNNDHITEPQPQLDTASTRLPSVAPRTMQTTVTAVEAYNVTAAPGSFIPGALVGIKLTTVPAGPNTFTVIANTDSVIYTLPADGSMSGIINIGDTIIGEHQLRNLIIRKKALVETADRIIVNGTKTVEIGSSLKAENHR